MSERCLKCFRPVQNCYCRDIKPIESRVKFVFLMHPHEAYHQRSGTGRLASLSLIDSEIIIDTSFDNNSRTKSLIANLSFYPVVLYPGEAALSVESSNFKESIIGRTLLIFLIDGTWIEARKMMYRSYSLRNLPRLSFIREYRSRFTIKKQPEDYCLSTIESSYYLLKELKEAKVCDSKLNVEAMMDVFVKMVNFQLECRKKRIDICTSKK